MSKTYDELKGEFKNTYGVLKKRTSDNQEAMNSFLSYLKASGKNEISQISRSEIKRYDMEWINYLEKAVNAIGAIVENPKRNLKAVRNIVPVELAKKITSESVIHLSQNSQYVKEIDEDGNVIPSKILTIEAEDDYAIYENRFVKTLIDKLIIFCHKRYEFMKDHQETKDFDIMTVKSSCVIDGVTFEYESKIKITQPSSDEGKKEYNEELFKKITMLVERVNFFKTTDFYKQVKDTKPVKNPILQTNIIVKNQNYKACYEVWKFLDKYDQLGISIRVKEAQGKFDDAYLDRIFMMTMMSELTLETDKLHKLVINDTKKGAIKPKLNKKIIDPSLDDTKFDIALTYGRDQMTKAQLAALKRKEAAEKARLKREEERKRQKELAKIKREQEKEKRRLALEKQKEKARLQKEKELERQRQRMLAQQEREREKERLRRLAEEERQRLLDEQEKLRRTRITVKRIADGQHKKLEDVNIVTDDLIKKDSDFGVKPIKKKYWVDEDDGLIKPTDEKEVAKETTNEEPQEPKQEMENETLQENVVENETINETSENIEPEKKDEVNENI